MTTPKTIKGYCAACGERKRLTYPRSAPRICTMKCAAAHFECLQAAGEGYGYCVDCGDDDALCQGECGGDR